MLYSVLLQTANTGINVTNQAVDTVAAVAGQIPLTTPNPEDELSLFGLMVKGGVVMIPLAILSILTIYFFFERFITLRKSSKLDANFMNSIKDYIHNGNRDAAKALCRNTDSPAARMIEKGVSRIGKPIKEIEEAMEGVGKLEINRLEKNLGTLSLFGRIGPILGFVGTIIGVIVIFHKLSLTNDINIKDISGGLYQKMITSASGLIVGLLAFIGYYILNAMLDKIINKMETAATEFIDILHEPTK